jgi:hypothetical protein
MVVLVGGCASVRSQSAVVPDESAVREPAAATALVFEPPLIQDQPAMPMWREPRHPAAFVGFQSVTSTVVHVRTIDRQSNWGDRFERRAEIHQVGAGYR